MIEDLLASRDWMGLAKDAGYHNSPIPQERDAKITGLLKTRLALDEPERREAASHISKRPYLLLSYSERMASLAVRERNQEWPLLGLLALGVDSWCFDWRDNFLLVPLHYDAARRI